MEEKDNFSGDEIMKMATAIYNKHFKCCYDLREDLISEGVLGIMSAINNYKREKGVKLSTYAWNMGKGKMMNFYNLEKERRANLTMMPDYEWLQDEGQDVKEQLFGKEMYDKVKKVVGGLKTEEQWITNSICEGYSKEFIAKRLGVTNQAVCTRWKRLKAKIVREYNGEGKSKRGVRR
jgi:RNA polymerase sigma factor (sigma-70 family)